MRHARLQPHLPGANELKWPIGIVGTIVLAGGIYNPIAKETEFVAAGFCDLATLFEVS